MRFLKFRIIGCVIVLLVVCLFIGFTTSNLAVFRIILADMPKLVRFEDTYFSVSVLVGIVCGVMIASKFELQSALLKACFSVILALYFGSAFASVELWLSTLSAFNAISWIDFLGSISLACVLILSSKKWIRYLILKIQSW